jgi:hypothetical protein
MTTTLSAMRLSRFKKAIIGGLLLAAALLGSGCTAVRLAYGNAPQLSWWWLDGYVDFSREQTPAAKQAIDRFFEWHRATQLPEYAALLSQAQGVVLEPTTAAQACRWSTQVRDKLEPALARAMAQGADLVLAFGETQFKSIEQRYAKGNADMRKDFLQPDPAERLAASVKRAMERAELLYGRLGEAQRRVVEAGVAASPFDPQAWLSERERRQRDTLQTLRRLVADKADREERVAALRALAERTERSPDPGYRAYQIKLTDYNCALTAQLQNATTPAQRRKALGTLKGWEEDLRWLVAQPNGNGNGTSGNGGQ